MHGSIKSWLKGLHGDAVRGVAIAGSMDRGFDRQDGKLWRGPAGRLAADNGVRTTALPQAYQ
jgi:hypothetical protein